MRFAEIYCHFSFLEAICNQVADYCMEQNAKISDVLNQESMLIPAVEAYKLIYKNAKTIFLSNDEGANIAFETSPYYKTLTKNLVVEPNQIFDNFDTDFYKNLYQHSFFFLNENAEKCTKNEEKYGIFCFSKQNWEETILRITERFDPILIWSKGNISNYEFMKNYLHPCNAMLISDEYLCKDKNPEGNIYQILDCLLPQKLEINFHLTIFTGDIAQFDAITEKLKTLRTNYTINFTIIQVTKSNPIHDRNLITNYFWINSGHGFHLFNRGKVITDRNTQLSFYSIFRTHCTHIIDQLKPIERNRDNENSKEQNQIKSNSDGKNRLLS